MSQLDPLDTKAVEALRKQRQDKAALETQQEIADVKWLMSNRRGRRMVWRQLEQAGVFRLTFNTNAMQMAFNEGMRSAGNRLLGLVTKLCPDQYVEMLKEQSSE
jgi:hypothetical protein